MRGAWNPLDSRWLAKKVLNFQPPGDPTVASGHRGAFELENNHHHHQQQQHYHLVMTNIAMERSTMLLIGKPSISMGHFPWLC